MKRLEHFVWVLALAFLAVGARNFESGMPVDGPLYAAIARSVARAQHFSEWVQMSAPVPEFVRFYEHPHLGIWTEAVCFKLFGLSDGVARLPGHIYYVLFFLLLYRWIKKVHSEKAATAALLLLVAMPRFSNYMSAGYFDPGLLFWGNLAVERAHAQKSAQAGLALGMAFMQKGLAILGFGPVLLFLFLNQPKKLASFVVIFLIVICAYQGLLFAGGSPDFLGHYWQRQVTQRFSVQADFRRLIEFEYWTEAFVASNGLLLLFLASSRFTKTMHVMIPMILFWSFVFLFAPNHRVGFQYNLLLLPWIAWVSAVLISNRIRAFDNVRMWRQATTLGALFLVAAIQYTPLRTHGNKEPGEMAVLKELKAAGFTDFLFTVGEQPSDFIISSPLAWYADIKISGYPVVTDLPKAMPRTALIAKLDSVPDFKDRGWCLKAKDLPAAIYVPCL